MYDLNTIRYMNGTPAYKRKIDRMVIRLRVIGWFKKIRDKIASWLYSKILTYKLFKYFRAHKYSGDEIQKG